MIVIVLFSGFTGLDRLLELRWLHSTINTFLELLQSKLLDHSGATLN